MCKRLLLIALLACTMSWSGCASDSRPHDPDRANRVVGTVVAAAVVGAFFWLAFTDNDHDCDHHGPGGHGHPAHPDHGSPHDH